MGKVTPDNMQAAYAAGREAFLADKPRVPAYCQAFLSLIEGFAIGDGAATLAYKWLNGFDEAAASQMTATATF